MNFEPLNIANESIDPDVRKGFNEVERRLASQHADIELLKATFGVDSQLPDPPESPAWPVGADAEMPWWDHNDIEKLFDESLSPGRVIYVERGGDDSADGTRTSPLKTLPEALNRQRRLTGTGVQIRLGPGVYAENDSDGGAQNVAKHEPDTRPEWHGRRWLTIAPIDPTAGRVVIEVSTHESGLQLRGDMLQAAGISVISKADPKREWDWFGSGIATGGRFRQDGRLGSAFFRIVGCDIEGMMGGGIGHGQTTHHLVAYCRTVRNAYWQPEAASGYSYWKAHRRPDVEWQPFEGIYTDIWYRNTSLGNDNKVLYDWGYGPTKSDGQHFIADLLDFDYVTGENRPYGGRILVAANVAVDNGGRAIHAFESSHVDAVGNTALTNSQRILDAPGPGEVPLKPSYEIGAAAWSAKNPTPIRVAMNAGAMLPGMTFEGKAGKGSIEVFGSAGRVLDRDQFSDAGVPSVDLDGFGAYSVDGSATLTLPLAAAVLPAR